MSDTPNPATLTLADLVAGDPPQKLTSVNGRPFGLRGKFKELIRQTPGVWYEFPVITRSGLGESNQNPDGYEWTTRTVMVDGKRMMKVWARYVG